MPALAPRAFRKALHDRAFASVYLLHGDDDFLKDAAMRQLVDAAVEPATRDFNLELRRGADLDAETLGALLGTPPMMADRRVVVVRDVGALRKDARRELDRYLDRPAPDSVVVLVALAGGKADRGLLEHRAVQAVEFRQLAGDELPKWVAHHLETEHGGSITQGAAELLVDAVGGDLPQLAAELDKLLSYTGGAEIDEHAVGEIVGVRRGETLGDFLDAVGARDARRALDLLPHVLAQPKTSGVPIVMALSMQTMALAWAQAARAEGLPASRLGGEFFALLKEGGGFAGRAWGEATRAWERMLPNWTAPALDRALDALLAADVALKESRVSSDEQILTTLVLSLCARVEEGRAAARA
ncbi:MAG TPA: DNA polymerase III subunit delta [Gemmatimonadaceae bacterium]